jgi:hypothetical protein
LNHKSKKNNHDRNQYRQKGHHEGIITREDFFAVQKMLRNAKYGNRGYFPEMHVIQEGLLRGYVTVHPRWAGFSVEDYYTASESIENGLIPSKPLELKINKGSIDLRGYELVRTQFMSTAGQISLSMNSGNLLFNKSCISKIPDAKCVELLVMPGKNFIAVRKTMKGSHNFLQWCREKNGERVPKLISGSAFLPTLSSLFGWHKDGRYKMIVHHDDPISEFYDLQNDPNEYDNLWGNPDYQALIFEYYQKCFNHAILINEDTVLGKKAVY